MYIAEERRQIRVHNLEKIIPSPNKILDYSICYKIQLDLSAPQFPVQRAQG